MAVSDFKHGVSAFLLLLIGIASLGPLQFGFHLAELNAPQELMTCQEKKPETKSFLSKLIHPSAPSSNISTAASTPSSHALATCLPLTRASFATVSSIYTIGALLGALASGPFASRRGRVSTQRLIAFFFLVGSAIEAAAPTPLVLGGGRFLAGIGGGAATVVVPLYISEVAPPAARGVFGAATQVGINVGILITQTEGFFFNMDGQWRWILATGAALALVQAMGLALAVESPAWIAGASGDGGRARRMLQRIRGTGADVEEETRAWGGTGAGNSEAEALLANGHEAPEGPTHGKAHLGFVQVVRNPLYRPAIVAVVGVMFAQQFCGINSIIMYSVSLLADLLPISSSLMTIVISIVNLVATLAFSPLPDKLGRKKCLLLSIMGQGSSALALALSILYGIKLLSGLAVLFFVAAFAAGLGPVPFILASELVGVEAVGAAQSWALGANYVATYLVAQFFPLLNVALNEHFGGAGWVYFIFAACALLSAVFVTSRVPETMGKRDADEVWGRTRRID